MAIAQIGQKRITDKSSIIEAAFTMCKDTGFGVRNHISGISSFFSWIIKNFGLIAYGSKRGAKYRLGGKQEGLNTIFP